jgi:hypothetical protein
LEFSEYESHIISAAGGRGSCLGAGV